MSGVSSSSVASEVMDHHETSWPRAELRVSVRERKLAECSAAEACGAQIQRCRAAVGRRGPCRFQEFLVGGREVMGAGADLLRLDHHGDGPGGQLFHEGDHGIHQDGGQRFHAFHRDAAGDLLQHVGSGGQLCLQRRGPGHHGRGDQDFAARRGMQFRGVVQAGRGQRPLVGNGEPAHLVHLVAEELHPDGVVLGGREDVQHAAADREFAAAGHHVHPGVGGVSEAAHHVAERDFLANLQRDGNQLAQSGHDRLDHRPDGSHHHAQRSAARLSRGVPACAVRTGGGPQCPSAGTAARAEGFPSWGIQPPNRPAGRPAGPR